MTHSSASEVTIQDFDPSVHPKQMAQLGALEDVWERDLSSANARLLTVQSVDGVLEGCALLTARSAGAYVKISSVLARSEQQRKRVVSEVLNVAQRQGLASVKWELWTEDPQLFAVAQELGFQRLPSPRRAGQDAGSAPVAGLVHWLNPAQYLQAPHYQQSENFTCAAVASLTAHHETSSIQTLEELRIAELLLWRQATNFMACEPIELGLTLTQRWPQSQVKVWLDTDQPVMVDYYPEAERDWREILQRQSRLRAHTEGLDISTQRLGIGEIKDAVANGAHVLLLVSLDKMLGFDVPHWVLCHGLTGIAEYPVLVIEDSWVNQSSSESWVDATCLPVVPEELDAMSVLESQRYRAALVLT